MLCFPGLPRTRKVLARPPFPEESVDPPSVSANIRIHYTTTLRGTLLALRFPPYWLPSKPPICTDLDFVLPALRRFSRQISLAIYEPLCYPSGSTYKPAPATHASSALAVPLGILPFFALLSLTAFLRFLNPPVPFFFRLRFCFSWLAHPHPVPDFCEFTGLTGVYPWLHTPLGVCTLYLLRLYIPAPLAGRKSELAKEP